MSEPYIRSADAARYLCFASPRALYKAITHGVTNGRGERIPVLYRGRTLLFQTSALDAWLHAEEPTRVTPFTGRPNPLPGKTLAVGAKR